MKRTLAAVTALALGATLGTAGAATWALWSQQTAVHDAVTIGYAGFAVGNPGATPAQMDRAFGPQTAVTWLANNAIGGNPITALQTKNFADAVIRVDGQSQGNRGLAYDLRGAHIIGGDDSSLVDGVRVRIVRAGTAEGCAPALNADAGTLYEGALSAAQIPARELVSSAYSTAGWETPEHEFLCLRLSRPVALNTTYTNIGSATGTYTNPQTGAQVSVSGEDRWSIGLGYDTRAFQATFSLDFGFETFRGRFAG
ncbi:hypothetical protein M2390_001355 [Mycetocola sp. BIGb0189]|uniref:hypothetical protein n=1 Tax=Mycetocola sp. BIGb0189 TaxID=2940604 RepID=UPI002168DE40|nr:hypothetical protein [Mycetocola sp. BIGb0189]MCS4276183.1 hypothetical protein [Mycetocola sp. BIGb0189]